MKIEFYKNIMNLINENIDFIKQTKTEKFKNDLIIDVILSNTILNIRVGENIIVDINNSMHQYLLDFSKNEKVFENFKDFETFFNSIISGIREKSKGLYATYEGEEYLCEIEVTSVDPDRQMGPETLYAVSFANNDGEEIIAAEISEYPMGAFSIYEQNSDVEIDESKILDFFQQEDE
jgi:hypothetical protein